MCLEQIRLELALIRLNQQPQQNKCVEFARAKLCFRSSILPANRASFLAGPWSHLGRVKYLLLALSRKAQAGEMLEEGKGRQSNWALNITLQGVPRPVARSSFAKAPASTICNTAKCLGDKLPSCLSLLTTERRACIASGVQTRSAAAHVERWPSASHRIMLGDTGDRPRRDMGEGRQAGHDPILETRTSGAPPGDRQGCINLSDAMRPSGGMLLRLRHASRRQRRDQAPSDADISSQCANMTLRGRHVCE